MKIADIPFNMTHKLDPATLLDQPVDYDEMKKGIDFLKEESLKEDDASKKALIDSMCANFLRIVKNYDEAEEIFIKAAKTLVENDHKDLAFVVNLKLALNYLNKKQYSKAESIFVKGIKKLRSLEDDHPVKKHISFALFNFGRLKYESKQYSSAVDFFSEALEECIGNGQMSEMGPIKEAIEVVRPLIK